MFLPLTTADSHRRVFAPAVLATLTLTLGAALAAAQGSSSWTLAPYRVRALIAVETSSVDEQELAQRIEQRINERSDSAIGALWNLKTEIAAPADRRLVSDLAFGLSTRRDALPEHEGRLEKTFLIAVKEDAWGVRVAVVEQDITLKRWSTPAIETVGQAAETPEAAFRLACEAFSPLAMFRVATNNPNRVELTFRGEQLPVRDGAPRWVREDDIFLPVLRRLDREGETDEDGIRAVPWTYVILTEVGEKTEGVFVSHTRRPLATRRRGRVERMAIRLPRQTGAATLRAHAREDKQRPLVGYQVYVQDNLDVEQLLAGKSAKAAERVLAGATGPDGRLTIEPGESRVLLAYIKSGSQLVAKLPIVPGAGKELDVPLLDETPRLEAEAKLGILREDLIDLVARRQIFIARIDDAIDEENYDLATSLIERLERLPARALFDRKLRQLEQASKSNVEMVQKRIDRIFADTRTVLAAFLNQREVQEVKSRLANARK